MSWHLYGLLALLLNYKEQCPIMAICLLSGDTISPQFMDANSEQYHSVGFYIYLCKYESGPNDWQQYVPACLPDRTAIVYISYGIK